MSTIDVEHVDLTIDQSVRQVGELANVTDAITDARCCQIGLEDGVVVGGGGLESVDLLRAPIIAGVRVDRHDLDPLRSAECEHDRGTPLEASDLDDPTTGRTRCSRLVEGTTLTFRHPTSDVGDSAPGLTEGHVYTATPNTIIHASPNNCSTRSLPNTSSGAAPWP